MFICVSNTTERKELEIGKAYELINHESGPKFVWVKIIDTSNTIGWRTIQCYASDFKSKREWRDNLIDKLLS
jgi:hypothetical protein